MYLLANLSVPLKHGYATIYLNGSKCAIVINAAGQTIYYQAKTAVAINPCIVKKFSHSIYT